MVMTAEREGITTLLGKPLVLLGPEVRVGDRAPDFRAVDKDFKPVTLSRFQGQACLISSVFSRKGEVIYKQIVPEIASHPDYEAALAAFQKA